MKLYPPRIAPWVLLAVVAAATLVPPELRPSSGLPLKVERALAFAILAGVFTLAYPRRWPVIAVLICLGAAGLELLQLLVPGRDASPVDAVVKILGTLAGVASALVLRKLWPR